MMEPGFYNMDCMDGMRQFPDKYFNLAIIDPPYGINADIKSLDPLGKHYGAARVAKTHYHVTGWDKEPPGDDYFRELFRVSKNQIIWGANHFISRIPYDSPAWVVWDKMNGDTDFADCELAWTSFKSAVRKVSFLWNGMLQGQSIETGRGGQAQGNHKLKEKRIHPTQKPVELYKWLLNRYATTGDMILDTHVGSASSLIACEKMGFQYVGFELDKKYYEDAKARLDAEKSKKSVNQFILHALKG